MPVAKKPAHKVRNPDEIKEEKRVFTALHDSFTDARDHTRNNKRNLEKLLNLTKDVSSLLRLARLPSPFKL
jgi:hypothetical protein